MLISFSIVPNTYSHATAVLQYLPREQINATESLIQQTNITESSLDQIIDSAKETKALVVVARSHETTQWMKDVHPDWIQYQYIGTEDTNPNSNLSVPENKGNEAMRYLSFIIDNYDSLPDIIAFRHGHNTIWHQRSDAVAEVNSLNLTTIRLRGYLNFLCEAVCGEHIRLAEMQSAAIASKNATNKLLSTRSQVPVDAAIFENWDSWFGVPMPEELVAACCAQFVVVKEAVHRRTREQYVAWRQWLLNTTLEDYHSGMVFERLWHVIFGMPPADCGWGGECYCNIYTGPLAGDCLQ